MAGYIHFTEEQKELARNKSIVDFLRSQGEKVERSGSEYVWMDGTAKVTLRGNLWYHVYEEQGHDIIAFLERYYNLTYPEAVEMLLNGEGGAIEYSSPIERKPKEPFSLPSPNLSMRRVYGYLLNERKLDKSVVDTFVKAGIGDLYFHVQIKSCVGKLFRYCHQSKWVIHRLRKYQWSQEMCMKHMEDMKMKW